MEGTVESIVRDYMIRNKLGLHARAASHFVELANRFECDIMVSRGGHEVNGKSIMGILMLAAAQGSTVTIKATGHDAAGAVAALGDLIDSGFGED